ncbi:glycosyltransferase [Haloarcula salina]|uniref:Glycosyltransferase n=1 Tax=Haloarcula salina TaxID=1429914 RepID=A0AA41KE12_9EURY|nr:glycosyltransferase [Haloarcula salina]MBV0900402.1 glycosyltransferase [Haloarcula salina]
MTETDFSVLLPTYGGDDATELDQSLRSCFEQTRLPSEVLIVEDGPLTEELTATLTDWKKQYPDRLRRIRIPENRGLGNALNRGVKECTYSLIARHDSDDINVRTRFERQIAYFNDHPDVDIVGGYIGEFSRDPSAVKTVRKVPTDHDSIEAMARFRSPMNHGTVMFRKGAVLAAGNYRAVTRIEDYDLWVRMFCSDATFANIPDILVKVRAGAGLAERRGGAEYARAEVRRQVEFYRRGFIGFPVFVFNVVSRVGLRFLPNRIRRWVYRTVARES